MGLDKFAPSKIQKVPFSDVLFCGGWGGGARPIYHIAVGAESDDGYCRDREHGVVKKDGQMLNNTWVACDGCMVGFIGHACGRYDRQTSVAQNTIKKRGGSVGRVTGTTRKVVKQSTLGSRTPIQTWLDAYSLFWTQLWKGIRIRFAVALFEGRYACICMPQRVVLHPGTDGRGLRWAVRLVIAFGVGLLTTLAYHIVLLYKPCTMLHHGMPTTL